MFRYNHNHINSIYNLRKTKKMSNLGSEPAYPTEVCYSKNGIIQIQTDNGAIEIGMSKRLKIATDCISVANNYLDNCSVDYISKIVGIDPLEYKGLIHYPQAVVKMAYIFANELLRQEAL